MKPLFPLPTCLVFFTGLVAAPDANADQAAIPESPNPNELDISGPETVVRVRYIRRKGSGLEYTPMKSANLQTGSFEPINGTETSEDIDGEFERVTVSPLRPGSRTHLLLAGKGDDTVKRSSLLLQTKNNTDTP